MGLENLDLELRALLLPMRLPDNDHVSNSIRALLKHRAFWNFGLGASDGVLVWTNESLYMSLILHCVNTFGDTAGLRAPPPDRGWGPQSLQATVTVKHVPVMDLIRDHVQSDRELGHTDSIFQRTLERLNTLETRVNAQQCSQSGLCGAAPGGYRSSASLTA